MPDPLRCFDHAIDAEARLAYGRMWGTVSGRDMLALATSVHDDPAWQNGFDAIWDCSRVLAHVVAPEELRPIIDEEVSAGDGHDVIVRSAAVGDGAISDLLAAFCRRRNKEMTVHATLGEALHALEREALPDSLVLAATA